MKKLLFVGGLGMALLITRPVGAQDEVCVGDCNGDLAVAINELILCVNIVLGNADVDACPACDSNMDGIVGIADLVAAVGNSLGSCDVDGDLLCGDRVVDEGEDCDDGGICVGGTPPLAGCNSAADCAAGEVCTPVGGDGCAANCTNETRRETVFAPETISTAQGALFPIQLSPTGSQVLTTGFARDTRVIGPNGQVITNPGEIPGVIKVADVKFDPVRIQFINCACVRGVEVPEFGPGNSAAGLLSCSETGLTDINYRLLQDHNTNPDDENNSGTANGLPDDPGCDERFTFPSGVISEACLEGTDPACSRPDNPASHTGVCNSPRVIEFSGGPAGPGSALINTNTAIALLPDSAALCVKDPPDPGGQCFDEYGADCRPCTDDDPDKGVPENIPTTTGTAEAALFDTNNVSNARIAAGPNCITPVECIVQVTGSPVDCEAFLADPTGGLSGSALATAFPILDAGQIADNVNTTLLVAE